MENNRNTEHIGEASDGKVYLTQIARYIAEQTGKAQQIIHTAERADITYSAYDEFNKPEETMPMTIILDADIDVKSIIWSAQCGLVINSAELKGSPAADNATHVILWSLDEVERDSAGCYVDRAGAESGILVIDGKMAGKDTIARIQGFPA